MSRHALSGALLFTLLSLPGVYIATDFLAKKVKLNTIDASGKPTMYGIGLHAVVFFLLSFLLMKFPASKTKSNIVAIALIVLVAIVIFVDKKKGYDKSAPIVGLGY